MMSVFKVLFSRFRSGHAGATPRVLHDGFGSLSLSDPGGNILSGEFSGRNDLTLVAVTAPARNIGDNAFEDCLSLKDAIIEDSVESIGRSAFCGCLKLSYVSLPSSLAAIGDLAFGCVGDTSGFLGRKLVIRYDGTRKQWESIKKSPLWISSDDGEILPHRLIFSGSELPKDCSAPSAGRFKD